MAVTKRKLMEFLDRLMASVSRENSKKNNRREADRSAEAGRCRKSGCLV